MGYTDDRLNNIFDKTDGHCHICSKKLSFSNYGKTKGRAPWEVDHSVPVAHGGTDHLNNLYPICVTCNRSKQDRSTRSIRAEAGNKRAPISKRERENKNTKRDWLIVAGIVVALLVMSSFSSR